VPSLLNGAVKASCNMRHGIYSMLNGRFSIRSSRNRNDEKMAGEGLGDHGDVS